MVGILIALLVTSVSLFIISKLPTGVEIESFPKAIISAIVFGIVNALLGPIFRFFAFPITFITFGLFNLVINAIIFGIAAALVPGFSLRWGFWSALLGAFLLSLVNSLIYQVFGAR
jgi:putative membrane protein